MLEKPHTIVLPPPCENKQNRLIDSLVCTERPADGERNSDINNKIVQVCTYHKRVAALQTKLSSLSQF